MPEEGRVIELRPIAEVHETEKFKNHGTEYPNVMAESTIDACLRLGLAPEFVSMFDAYLRDLNLITFDETETRDAKPAMLAVLKIPNGSDGPSYKRVMMISEQEARKRTATLQEVFDQFNLNDIDEAQLQTLALDWLFNEMAMAALGAACFMQQQFPKYIADWDGTNKYDNAHRTLSTNYLKQHPELQVTAKEDTKKLIKGFGIIMVHNAMLAKGLVGNATHANWIVEELRRRYQDAYRGEEIADRITSIKPSKDLKKVFAQFALAVCDPDIDLDSDD